MRRLGGPDLFPVASGDHSARLRRGPLGVAVYLLAFAALAASLLTYVLDGRDQIWAANSGWTLGALCAAAGTGEALRRGRPSERRAWGLLLAAAVVWLVGELLFFRWSLTAFPASPNVGDLCWVLFAALGAWGVLGFNRRSEGSITRALETTPLVVAVGAVVTAMLWGSIETSELPAAAQTTVLAYAVSYVIAAMLMVQAVVSGAVELRNNVGMWLVVGGLVAEAVAFILWSPLLLSAEYAVGAHAVDLLFTVGLVLLGVGALRAGPVSQTADPGRIRRRRGGLLPWTIFAFLTGYQLVYSAGERDGAEIALTAGFLVVGVALIARAAVVRRHEAELYERLESRERELADTNRRLEQESQDREAANKELQGILDSAGEGIYGLATDGRATFVNPAAARMTGHAVEDLVGQPLHSVIHHSRADGSPYPVEECPMHLALIDGTKHTAEDVYWHRDGTAFPVSCTSMPIQHDGQVTGAVVVFRDISERKEVERRKDEFTSIVSHELRTPLTSIRGSLGLMAGGALGEVPAKAQRMLDIAVANTDRLIRLINDILDIERIESGNVQMQRTTVSTPAVVEAAVEGVRGMAQQHAVNVEWRVEPEADAVFGDADRIIQTLTNLLSNAIKFSPAGGVVGIEARREGLEVLFSVRDEGRGIPADRLDAIFGRFEQVDASDARDMGGTGLGLAICRSIVVQHGGRIWAESTPGAGSTFRFTVPGIAALAVAQDADPPDGRPTVAVCDDDGDVREVVMEMLHSHGYRAVPAASGEHLLEIVQEQRPSVVVLDLVMEGMSGWEAAERLSGAGVPLVIVTVLPREEAGPLADDCAAFLQKPLDEGALVAAIDRALAPLTPRVLVVEDDAQLADVICTALQPDFDVSLARTGHEAIELAQRTRPDALVLDLTLPGPDGFEVIEALGSGEPSEVPVIVYTAQELTDAERARLSHGRDVRFLTKGRTAPVELGPQVMAAVRDRTLRGRESVDA